MIDPITLWAKRYVVEEAIYRERDALAELRRSIAAKEAVAAQLGEINRVLERLPPIIAERYSFWAGSPASFDYGSEARYQLRALSMIERLANTGFAVDKLRDVLCIRQVINPSAFNGTPRIARVGGASFVIFPAPMVYWMYAICSMIAAGGGDGELNKRKLNLYLRYIIAARSFERQATPLTAHYVDYLIDAIVHSGEVEDVDSDEGQPSNFTMMMISAVEHFVLCHELAHMMLEHVP